MLDDLNNVFLEGMIVFAPEIKENNSKRAMNFVVENERHTSKGRESFKYNCVAWDKVIERVGDRMLPGTLIRITGHLQDSVLQVDTASVNSETKEVMVEKRPFHHTKVCADYIEFND